jgi:SAM-dependent methyltransferase
LPAINVRVTKSSVSPFSNKVPGFERPTQLPRDDREHRAWQAANKAWWEAAPMRYDWRDTLAEDPGSEAYFKEIDRRFLAAARVFIPWREIPFDAIIPFDDLRNKDVLEIGVGHGTHAQLLATHARSFVGIDLTMAAAGMTAKRMNIFALSGTVVQMDAECMGFPAASFDYIWSWGVIHVSADTQRVLKEMHRVLRPGGQCTVMVYYRSWWNYYVSGFLRGLFQGHYFNGEGLHRTSLRGTDGAIARYYRPAEWSAATRGLFSIETMAVYGLKSDVLLLPHGRLKRLLMDLCPDAFARFLTSRLRMGGLLVARMRKPFAAP